MRVKNGVARMENCLRVVEGAHYQGEGRRLHCFDRQLRHFAAAGNEMTGLKLRGLHG